MRGNPEFVRNLWLEAKPPRLIAMIALLGALFLLLWLRSGFSSTLSNTALTIYVAIVFIWGNRLAANSVIQEVNNGTWDSQRMSAISPWAMTIGKLYGSTAFVWLGGLICLAVYWLAQSGGGGSAEPLQTTIIYLGCGLLSHIISLIVSLVAIRKKREYGRLRVWLYQFIGLAAAAPILFFGTRAIDNSGRMLSRLTEMTWYGMPLHQMGLTQFGFIALAIAIYVVWGNIGVYRMMRVELLSRNGPWVWLCFTVFTAIFFAGIHMPRAVEFISRPTSLIQDPLWRSMAIGALVVLLLTYGVTLAERKDPFVFLRLKRFAADRRWRNFFEFMPRAAPTLIIAFGIVATMTGWALKEGDDLGSGTNVARLISLCLFAARDMGFITLMSLWRPSPRADMTALVWLAISYTLIPALLFAAGIYSLRPLFQPVFHGDAVLNLSLIGIETIVVYVILAITIRSVTKTETP